MPPDVSDSGPPSDQPGPATPFTDGDANWVDSMTALRAPFDPVRFSSTGYWRRTITALVLIVAAEAVVFIRFGATWVGLGALLIAVAALAEMRWKRTPILLVCGVAAIVACLSVPSNPANAGPGSPDAVSGPPSCRLIPTSDLSVLFAHPDAVRGQSRGSSHCIWTPAPAKPGAPGSSFTLTVSTPQDVPVPTPGAVTVAELGLRSWTTTSCLPTACSQELDVVLNGTYLNLVVTSSTSDAAAWNAGGAARRSKLVSLARVVEKRIDDGQCAYPGDYDCTVS